MNEAGVAPPGLKPIQKPMKALAHEGAPVARQDLPRLPAPPRGLMRALTSPGSDSPSSTESRISPIPKSPMTATMKSKPFISSVMPNVSRSWPGHDVEPDGGEDEADQDRDERLERVAAAQADERGEGQELDREELRAGRTCSATSASSGAKSVISTTEKSAPTNEEVKAAVSAWPPCPCRAIG